MEIAAQTTTASLKNVIHEVSEHFKLNKDEVKKVVTKAFQGVINELQDSISKKSWEDN